MLPFSHYPTGYMDQPCSVWEGGVHKGVNTKSRGLRGDCLEGWLLGLGIKNLEAFRGENVNEGDILLGVPVF